MKHNRIVGVCQRYRLVARPTRMRLQKNARAYYVGRAMKLGSINLGGCHVTRCIGQREELPLSPYHHDDLWLYIVLLK